MMLLVALGGGLGAALRFVVDGVVNSRRRTNMPLGSLVVNVLGSFALGLVSRWWAEDADARWLLGVGLLGGFTTFGTAMVESVRLGVESRARQGLGLALAMLTLGLGGATLGWLLGG